MQLYKISISIQYRTKCGNRALENQEFLNANIQFAAPFRSPHYKRKLQHLLQALRSAQDYRNQE